MKKVTGMLCWVPKHVFYLKKNRVWSLVTSMYKIILDTETYESERLLVEWFLSFLLNF